MRDAIKAVGDEQHVEFAFVTVSHEHPFARSTCQPPANGPPWGRKASMRRIAD